MGLQTHPFVDWETLEAYTAMDEDKSSCYSDLREALLAKFDISPEMYRQRFRATSTPLRETPTETYHRLKGLYRHWMHPEQRSKDHLGDQLLQVLLPDTRTWIREHEPQDGLTAVKLAMQYLNARRRVPSRATWFESRDSNHPRESFLRNSEGNRGGNDRGQTFQPKTLVCYHCQQQEHKASICLLTKPKLTGMCYVPRKSDC